MLNRDVSKTNSSLSFQVGALKVGAEEFLARGLIS
jgi:hypothetical protein